MVTMPLSSTFPRYSRILVENCYPLVFGAPVRGEAIKSCATTLGDEKREWWAYQTVKDTFRRFDTIHTCDRRTDRRNWRGIYALWHICCHAEMKCQVAVTWWWWWLFLIFMSYNWCTYFQMAFLLLVPMGSLWRYFSRTNPVQQGMCCIQMCTSINASKCSTAS